MAGGESCKRVSHEMSCRIFRRGLRRATAKERQAKGGWWGKVEGVGVGVPHKTMCKLCDSRHAQWGKGTDRKGCRK